MSAAEIIVIVVSVAAIAAFTGGVLWLIFAPWNKTRNHAAVYAESDETGRAELRRDCP